VHGFKGSVIVRKNYKSEIETQKRAEYNKARQLWLRKKERFRSNVANKKLEEKVTEITLKIAGVMDELDEFKRRYPAGYKVDLIGTLPHLFFENQNVVGWNLPPPTFENCKEYIEAWRVALQNDRQELESFERKVKGFQWMRSDANMRDSFLQAEEFERAIYLT
jgi:hypothetical protein